MPQPSVAAKSAFRDRNRLGAGEARIWALVIVAVAYWANIVRGANTDGGLTLASVINCIVDNGAFDVFAWILIFARASTALGDEKASLRQIASIVVAGAVALVPARLASALALVVLGSTLLADPRLPVALRQVRLLLFALALETLWMSPLVAPLHVLVGGLDARAAAALLRAAGQTATYHANIVDNAGADFRIAVWPYCTSSFPLADVSLAFLAMVLYRGGTWRRSHLRWLALSFAASVLLTEVRLAFLAASAESYHWWHFGPGVTVYALAALGAAVAFPILATSEPVRAERRTIARPAA